ncbi:MAG TPA: amidohydrolase family protein [Vicinamibacterales bacterium]|nr:amidohydrolase family protein [Vicinamibacterales bacterium]
MSRRILSFAAIAAALAAAAHADVPRVYAIRGARIVTAAGAPIASGTVVLRDGSIQSAGPDVQPPADARVIDGAGLTVYPGLIDMANTSAVTIPQEEQPRELRTSEELERWKRGQILRPQLETADYVKPDAPDLRKLASAGITAVLAAPSGQVVQGRSALINVAAPEEDPQIGGVADPRAGLVVLKTPVALHVQFTPSPRPGGAYPASLMGSIAFVRQAFLDAQHHQAASDHYGRMRGAGLPRPVRDPALEAFAPALSGRMPVAFEAGAAREILRALGIAAEFKLDPIIVGGLESEQVLSDLKARGARVIYSLNYPSRPRTLAPDADEPLRTLRERAEAPKTPAALEKTGVLFAFGSAGLREPKDFVKNAAKAVREGLAPDAAVRALTINAARVAGVADRLGSIERGKIANLVVTEGDLFDEKMKVKHVFIDGRPVNLEEPAPARERRDAGGTEGAVPIHTASLPSTRP